MTEPVITVGASGAIVIAGIATGLDPALVFAGACGGLWSLSYLSGQTVLSGMNRIALSSIIAAYSAPFAADWLGDLGIVPAHIEHIARYPIALVVGLVAVPVLGREILRLARQRLNSSEGSK